MATIINADTSDGLKFTSDTSGEINLQSGGATIATVDSSGITAASGKVFSGDGSSLTSVVPQGSAFRAYKSGAVQDVGTGTWTKVVLETESFDTNGEYDTSTSRFTPTVEGYYLFNGSIWFTNNGNNRAGIYKNGSAYSLGGEEINAYGCSVSAIVYLNGSTDYVELYVNNYSGHDVENGSQNTYLDGVLVRAA